MQRVVTVLRPTSLRAPTICERERERGIVSAYSDGHEWPRINVAASSRLRVNGHLIPICLHRQRLLRTVPFVMIQSRGIYIFKGNLDNSYRRCFKPVQNFSPCGCIVPSSKFRRNIGRISKYPKREYMKYTRRRLYTEIYDRTTV